MSNFLKDVPNRLGTIPANTQIATDAAIGADHTLTVEANATYIAFAANTSGTPGGITLGWADVTTDSNIFGFSTPAVPFVFDTGTNVTLHYEGIINGDTIVLLRLE